MAVRQRRGGVEVDGLAGSIAALGKVSPLIKKEAVAVLRAGAKEIQAKAQGSIGGHPSYLGPTNRGMIGRSATSTGAGVKLRAVKYPWALGAEFGEKVAEVPIYRGRGRRGDSQAARQASFKRRTMPPFKPPSAGGDLFKNKGGYMIQPAIRKIGPKVVTTMQRELLALFRKHLKAQGVKVSG